jgi:hypothetical protein
MNLAKLWFWEFTEDPYDITVATGETAAQHARMSGFHLPGSPRRMTRDEVVAAGKGRPTMMGTRYEDHYEDRYEWDCAKWLEEIEAAQKREAYEAELSAKQVELFR